MRDSEHGQRSRLDWHCWRPALGPGQGSKLEATGMSVAVAATALAASAATAATAAAATAAPVAGVRGSPVRFAAV